MIPVFIIMLISSIFVTGCEKYFDDYEKLRGSNKVPKEDVAVMCQDDNVYGMDSVIYYKTTLELDNKKHEYIRMDGYRKCALTHYPECKYCKKK